MTFMLNFAEPLWLLIGALLSGALVWLFVLLNKNRQSILGRFASVQLLPQLTSSVPTRRRQIKATLFITALFLLTVALARPQFGFRWEEVHRKGVDILIALDTSKSMLAEDVRPNRLERAKLSIRDFINKLDGDRVGLLPFAGSSFLLCPFTVDYNALGENLDAVDVNIIPRGGTDIADVIRSAKTLFSEKSGNEHYLILMTDGEDLEGGAITAAAEAAAANIKIYTIGIGTPNGSPIPVPQSDGGVSFLQNQEGQIIRSRLDESTLRAISDKTGGAYYTLSSQSDALEQLYFHHLNTEPKQDISQSMQKIPYEQFQFPLLACIVLLMIEYMLRETPRLPLPKLARLSKAGVVGLFLLSFSLAAQAAETDQAIRDYNRGLYASSEGAFKKALGANSEEYELQYNYGAAAYRNGNFRDASEAFRKSLRTPDLSLQQRAYYNLGNSLYRTGQESAPTSPDSTIELWKKSLDAYQNALTLNSQDEDASYNYEFVKKRLKELEKKQQEKKQQDQKDQKQQNQQQQKQDSSQQDPQQSQGDQKPKPSPQNGENPAQPNNPKDSGDQQKPQGNNPSNKQENPTQPSSEKSNNSNPSSKNGGNPLQEQMAEAQRRREGKMTRAEALRLLDASATEEKRMEILPAGNRPRNNKDQQKDW